MAGGMVYFKCLEIASASIGLQQGNLVVWCGGGMGTYTSA